ncbi:MAG TPA: murein L,D-transpeptidase family protein [Beijerinckiaceae bacterium]|nr:murein L,D-transpeptidase family protein [Beijerinckiaceae bacterium]
MRRRLALLILLAALAGAVALLLKPEFAYSLRDRAVRVAGRIAPELAARWRLGNEAPLEARLTGRGFAPGSEAFIRIFKAERQLELWLRRGATFTLFQTYDVCSWSGDLGPKLKEGDGQAPEGFYAVGLKQLNPRSAYYRAFDLGFPNAYDRAHGRTGSLLMVHGDCLSIGCYAMTDKVIDDIYRLVEAALRNGQKEVPVHVFPFRMTAENLSRFDGSRWASFWQNLKQGHDIFETTRSPPAVHACGTAYAFDAMAHGVCDPITAW